MVAMPMRKNNKIQVLQINIQLFCVAGKYFVLSTCVKQNSFTTILNER